MLEFPFRDGVGTLYLTRPALSKDSHKAGIVITTNVSDHRIRTGQVPT